MVWLRNARLHLAPYSDPCFPIAVASTITPFGMAVAGRHGVGVLSIGAGLPGGPSIPKQWQIAEETAAEHGKIIVKLAGRRRHAYCRGKEQALKEIHAGERRKPYLILLTR